MKEISSAENMPSDSYPKLLTSAPYHQTAHFFGYVLRYSLCNPCPIYISTLRHMPETTLDFYQESRNILNEYLDTETISSLSKIELVKLDLNIGKTYLKIDYKKASTYFDRAYEILLTEEGEESSLVQNALAHKSNVFRACLASVQKYIKVVYYIIKNERVILNETDLSK